MLCLVNTVVWCWDMDHNQSNEDTYRSIWVMGLEKDAENIMDREGHEQRSFIKNENEETSVHHHSN